VSLGHGQFVPKVVDRPLPAVARIEAKEIPRLILETVLANVPVTGVVVQQREQGALRRLVTVLIPLASADLVQDATLVEEGTPPIDDGDQGQALSCPAGNDSVAGQEFAGFRR
jgi:hypothetical protein